MTFYLADLLRIENFHNDLHVYDCLEPTHHQVNLMSHMAPPSTHHAYASHTSIYIYYV